MEDGARALGPDAGRPAAAGMPRALRRPSAEPHHRRRRLGALAGLAALAFIVGVAEGAGSGGTMHHLSAPQSGFLARIRGLAGTGTGSLAAAEQAAENAAINRTLSYTPAVQVAGAQHREIALTFDDGPGPYTQRVLSVLEREGAPGTFFEVGSLEHYFNAGTSQILTDGFPIGDHTQTHAPMSQLSRRDQRSQILQMTSSVGNFGAPFPRLFRPPYGLWNKTTLSILRKYRMLMVLWTVDTEDYRLPGVSSIVHTVLSGAQPGAIVLMHDAGGNRAETVEALPKVIRGLRSRGYALVTVPRLLLDNPAPANQQLSSTSGGGG